MQSQYDTALLSAATFWCSAIAQQDMPRDFGCEVVFVGRSNCGKSSLLNALTGRRGLAYVGKQPGRTQTVNFYRLKTDSMRLVDVPGYGYAQANRSQKRMWGQAIETYLRMRRSIACVYLLMDARMPLQTTDMAMLDFAHACGIPVDFVCTKFDKLNQKQRASLQRTLQMHGHVRGASHMTSSRTKVGIADLKAAVVAALTEHETRV